MTVIKTCVPREGNSKIIQVDPIGSAWRSAALRSGFSCSKIGGIGEHIGGSSIRAKSFALGPLGSPIDKRCAPRSRKLPTPWVASFRGPQTDLPVGRSKAVQRDCTVGLGRVVPTGGANFTMFPQHLLAGGGVQHSAGASPSRALQGPPARCGATRSTSRTLVLNSV